MGHLLNISQIESRALPPPCEGHVSKGTRLSQRFLLSGEAGKTSSLRLEGKETRKKDPLPHREPRFPD